MSDFNALESSVEESRSAELYRFEIGVETFLYTSSEDVIPIGIDDYVPESIKRDNIVVGPGERSRSLELQLPATNPFAARYLSIVPGQVATCTIYAIQRDELPSITLKQIFEGTVRGVRFPGTGVSAIMGLRSSESATSRAIPRRTYQALCNWTLYDAGCGVDPALFSHVGLVTDVTDNTITVTGASAFADGTFNAGFAKPAGISDFRLITGHVGNVISLLLPFPTSIVGQNVTITQGCDHLIAGHCLNRFNNVSEHSGFAFIPLKNPFETGL
jgi:uncharacterized phage protein (TIGR02218 family)